MQFIPTQPEIPRVPVGRPVVRSVGFIYLIFICPVDFGNININLPQIVLLFGKKSSAAVSGAHCWHRDMRDSGVHQRDHHQHGHQAAQARTHSLPPTSPLTGERWRGKKDRSIFFIDKKLEFSSQIREAIKVKKNFIIMTLFFFGGGRR